MEQIITEAVETCPYCGAESTFPNWDTATQGYVAVCRNCHEQIMLCDECLHAEDNETQRCNWHEITCGPHCTEGHCFRGVTKNNVR